MPKQTTLSSFFAAPSPSTNNKKLPAKRPKSGNTAAPSKRPRSATSTEKESKKEKANPSSTDPAKKSGSTKPSNPTKPSKPDASKSVESSEPVSLPRACTLSNISTKSTWAVGAPVPYKQLAETFSKVEQISGRLEIQAILSYLFLTIIATTPADLVTAIYLCINKLAPAHAGIELGIGETVILKSLSQVTGRSTAALKSKYKQLGDLGDVASVSRTAQKTMFPPPPLTVQKVFQEFKTIAEISGSRTQDAKTSRIVKMLVAASKLEAKYIARALMGKLRIHLADKTVIAALASAFTLLHHDLPVDFLLTNDGKKKTKLSPREETVEEKIKDATNILSTVYSQLPVWDSIVPHILKHGNKIDDQLIEECKLLPGVPVSPMLAKPTKEIQEVLDRFSEVSFTCEYKYDGERAQVHRLHDGSMRIYSRNAENLTPKYPDLLAYLPTVLKKEFANASFIIDSETVAYDVEKKQILPFQELQSRKRKDVNEADIKVKVCVFAFDLLFFNGESLINKTFKERRERLRASFVEEEGKLMFAEGHDSREADEIMVFLNNSIKAGCEGLMVKALEGSNSTYEPANRSQNWLKVKKDYLEGCGDSLDLVPIGGYIGKGKRTGQYGAFLLACYDPENEEYQSICKIGTGFTEVQLEEFATFYNNPEEGRKSERAKPYYRIPAGKNLAPDVWFEPVQVWEVKCADLSISPQHMASVGTVDPEKGIALRFPRFLRIRDDKKPEDATSGEQVAEMYMNQSTIANAS